MESWEILKHLEQGGKIGTKQGDVLSLNDLEGWDYDPIRNPQAYFKVDVVGKFKKELKALLGKYNAALGWECDEGSDTHGIQGEQMTVTFADPFKPIVTARLTYGNEVVPSDL